jgi:hypothetical protein
MPNFPLWTARNLMTTTTTFKARLIGWWPRQLEVSRSNTSAPQALMPTMPPFATLPIYLVSLCIVDLPMIYFPAEHIFVVRI